MSTIVCATRGGASSLAVQQRAIELARAEGHRLIFLYVIDTTSLFGLDEPLLAAVCTELHWMGETLVNIAKKRAEDHGVAAEAQIRQGDLKEEIASLLNDEAAELLLLGTPRGTTRTVFGDDAIERFATTIREDTGVRVELVHVEEVLESW
jgi:nucleotide-binding universal stress UspA family protein